MNILIRHPSTIFQNCEQSRMESALRYQAQRYAHQLHQPFREPLKRRLEWMPHLIGQLIVDKSIQLGTEAEFFANPYVAFFAIRAAYNVLAPKTEEIYLLKSPVALSLVIHERRRFPKSWLHTEEFYLTRLRELDPARYYLALEPDKRAVFLQLARAAESFAAVESPSWAYLKVAESAVTEVPASIAEILSHDEELLYQAALLIRDRSGEAAPLLSRLKSPRWAFHALRNRLTEEPASIDRLLKCVKEDAAWAVELMASPIWDAEGSLYAGSSSLRSDAFKMFYLSVATAAAQHPCINSLHAWAATVMCPAPARMVQAIQELALPAAAH
jgi:hypothetical protein